MINWLRYKYRKFLLFWIPVRSYVLELNLPPQEIISKLQDVIQPDKMYFLFPSKTDKPYTGKFMVNQFVAIKRNGKFSFKSPIKVRGIFYLLPNQKMYVRLILSNPFSMFNILFLFITYCCLFGFRVYPFSSIWLNILAWLFPLFLTYMFTNISFQSTYKHEKLRFFKLFKGRRLNNKQIAEKGI